MLILYYINYNISCDNACSSYQCIIELAHTVVKLRKYFTNCEIILCYGGYNDNRILLNYLISDFSL